MKPTNPRAKLFENQQDAVRKAVERVFAVLFQRFSIIYQPSRIYDKGNMENVVYTCCIIHKMVADVRREIYSVTKNASITDLRMHIGSHVKLVEEPKDLKKSSLFWMARLNEEESPYIQDSIMHALASLMWSVKGETADLTPNV
jgi:hypothetical protein